MLYIFSKIFWLVASPGNLCVILIVAGAIWLALSRRRHGLWLVGAGTVGLLLFIVLPLGHWMTTPLEMRFQRPRLPVHVHGIVVLGGSVRAAVPRLERPAEVSSAGERMVATAELARRYPQARILVTGGDGSLNANAPREAPAMRAVLERLGIDPARVEMEDRSRNTHENAIFSKELIKPKLGEVWVLVTSAFHMPRAMGTFRNAGWTVVPYPVDFRSSDRVIFNSDYLLSGELRAADIAIKEWVGLLAYRFIGWSDAWFPGP